eukprot:6252232-Amphidinium_carterae.1
MWYYQVLFASKTSRTLPQGAFASSICLDFTENHWQSAESLVRYIAWMDKDINLEHPGRPWMCILDAAPVHVGAEFRSELRKAVSHIFLAFVSAGYTSVCQPLDVAVMRPFKAALQRACVEDFASSVHEAGAGYKVNSSLATNKPSCHTGLPLPLNMCLAWRGYTLKHESSSPRHTRQKSQRKLLKMQLTVGCSGRVEEALVMRDVDVDNAEAEEFDLMQDDVYDDGGPEPVPKPKPKAKAGSAELTQAQRLLALRLCYGQPSAADLATM